MYLEAVTRTEGFATLADQWEDLMARSGSDSVFLTYHWLYTWWEVFGAGNELLILLVREKPEGELRGIFPGYLKTSGGAVKTRSVRLLGSEHVTSDFLGCIVARGAEHEVHRAVCSYLQQLRDHWDVIEMTDLCATSSFAGFLRGQDILPPFRELDGDKVCPFLQLPASFEELLATLSPKSRRNVRYYRNNLGRNAEVEVEEVRTPEQLDEVMQDMARLHQERKRQVGLASRFSSQGYADFHRLVSARFLSEGRLLLVFLKVDGVRVSFFYSFTYKGRVNIYQSGFDVEWGKFSVGALLLGHLVEIAIRQKSQYVDFLRGGEEYKYRWPVQERMLSDFTAYNDSLRGTVLKGGRQGLVAAKAGLKKVLPEKVVEDLRRFFS